MGESATSTETTERDPTEYPRILTPKEAGFRMPAEYELHERTFMAWPMRQWWNEGLPPGDESGLDSVRRELAWLAGIVAQFEPVTMIVPPECVQEAREYCGEEIDLLTLYVDDNWIRDTGPTFVVHRTGEIVGVDFHFQEWGHKYVPPMWNDRLLAGRLCGRLGLDCVRAPIVLEGGNICVDGDGTALVSASAVFAGNRNPGMGPSDAVKVLTQYLGVDKVILLPGNMGDTMTDGHIDGIACFVEPGVVLCERMEEVTSPEYDWLEECYGILKDSTDAKGRQLQVVELKRPNDPKWLKDPTFSSCYINFYILNGGVIMPAFGETDADAIAKETVERCFPDRSVRQLNAPALASGGGWLHCATQQLPRFIP